MPGWGRPPSTGYDGALMTRIAATHTVAAETFFRSLMNLDFALRVNQLGLSRCFEGWAVHPRTITDHRVYLVAESSLQGRIGERRLRLDPGGICWVMPGVQHEFWLGP